MTSIEVGGTRAEPPAPGVGGEVVVAALVLVAAVVPALVVLPHDRVALDATLPVLGWFPLGIAAVVLLDRRPGSRLGRSAVVAAVTPALVLGWAAVRVGEQPLRATVADVGPFLLLPLLLPVLAVASPRTRADRRWRAWVTAVALTTAAVATGSWALGSPTAYGVTTFAGLVALAGVVLASGVVPNPRPVDEPLLDLALVAGVLGVAALTGWLVRLLAVNERIFGADVMGVVAGAMTTALAVPGAVWLRRERLARRYGRGVLSPEDVWAITADLGAERDPRRLLATAADMVTATSGVRSARVVLDEDDEPGWDARPLLVGEDLVGTLLVQPSHADGLEARQERVVDQLLPTIALVARAVSLAVDAVHARSDVTRQREAERSRILADLHDDLGPVLAGMSMRVAAARADHPMAALDALADDLATCRADLRRIVSGLTPSALRSGDAADAVTALVRSFAAADGVEVSLEGAVPTGIHPAEALVVYRTVAEGLTNALRHANAGHVGVAVQRDEAGLRVTVVDDGRGGAVVPGVGLTSLQARADELGGRLEVGPADGAGTRLILTLPERG